MLTRDEARALLELVQASLNSSSEHKGATLLHVRDVLESALQSGGCEDCGEPVGDPDERFCLDCCIGRLNA